jgi:hypothetical protein
MTFAEFQIRLFAWKRTEEREWEKVRILAWYAMTGSHQDPKKMPKSITQFMKLGIDKNKPSLSEAQKERFLEVTREYLKNKK